MLDQALHSGSIDKTLRSLDKLSHSKPWPASAHLLAQIQHQCGMSDWLNCSVEHIGAWPHRFSHLVSYGGKYYSYMMARAGADLVWRHCFSQDPWSSTQGKVSVCVCVGVLL